jgi:iron complex transport system substrate-binding protein
LLWIVAASSIAASTANFTLSVFGNANLDDTINEQDVAYVQDVIKGTKAPTNLTDANHDGKVDEKDIEQIKQIINGTEKELIIYDDSGDAVTINEPVSTAVASSREYDEALRAIEATDSIIAVDTG